MGGKGGMQFASCSYDRTICIWDSSDCGCLQVLRTWKAGENAIMNLCLVGDRYLASCGADKEVKVFDFEEGECVCKVQTRGIAGAISMIDDRTIAIGGGDATIRVFDWTTEKNLNGEFGFYAHDFSISYMSGIFRSDVEQNWTQEPITFHSLDRSVGESHSQKALSI